MTMFTNKRVIKTFHLKVEVIYKNMLTYIEEQNFASTYLKWYNNDALWTMTKKQLFAVLSTHNDNYCCLHKLEQSFLNIVC